MKRLFSLLIAVFLLAGAGVFAEEAKEKSDGINRSMDIRNEQGELSTSTFLVGDTAYYTMWGTITMVDSQRLWQDLIVLKDRGVKNLYIYINSPGGSGFDGLAFADMIRQASKDFNVITEASGIVASAAVPIFVSGKRRIASENTVFMVHTGKLYKFFAQESLKDLQAQTRMLQLLEDRYNKIITENSNITVEEIKAFCEKETWFTAQQGMEHGFVDEIR